MGFEIVHYSSLSPNTACITVLVNPHFAIPKNALRCFLSSGEVRIDELKHAYSMSLEILLN